MTRVLLSMAMVAGCASTATTVPPPPPRAFVDVRAIAEQLVEQVADVQPDENVLILGEPRFASLLEELWLATRARGAQPLVQLGGPELFERYFDEVPAARDNESPTWELALAEMVDVLFKVQPHHPELIRKAPANRLAVVNAALEPTEERKIERKVRQVLVGNGLLPTDGMAAYHGLSDTELEAIFWAGIATDPETLRGRGKRIRGALHRGQRLRVTHPNGTDLTLEITDRPVFSSTGTITPSDIEAGASGIIFLPAGEVWCTPVPGTAAGRVVINRARTAAGDIEDLNLTVAAGAVTEITARPSTAFDSWRAQYAAAPAGKEQLSWLDIGLNPAVTPPAGQRLLNFVVSGMVTLGVGKNTWAGGENAVPYGVYLFLPGATVIVDDEDIVRNGELL